MVGESFTAFSSGEFFYLILISISYFKNFILFTRSPDQIEQDIPLSFSSLLEQDMFLNPEQEESLKPTMNPGSALRTRLDHISAYSLFVPNELRDVHIYKSWHLAQNDYLFQDLSSAVSLNNNNYNY